MTDYQLDATRLLCPLPVIYTQNKVKDLSAGDTLTVTCTDRGAMHDIPAWARVNGHQIIETNIIDNLWIITVRVGA